MKFMYPTGAMLILVFLFGCMPMQMGTEQAKTRVDKDNSLVTPSPSEAQTAIKQGALILDVRSAEEFSTGHYPSAINIPHSLITQKAPTLIKDTKKTIVVYCKSGFRAEVAKQELNRLGFAQVINAGGLTDINN